MKLTPAIFIDRDGVINREPIDYVKSVDEFFFLPGVLDALEFIKVLKWPVIVVTNQAGIGHKVVTEQSVQQIHVWMVDKIRATGGRIDAIYYCPHTPEQQCECRKPSPGLLLRAAKEFPIDLSRSYMIGDTLKDLQAALSAKCKPVLVRTGRDQHYLDLVVNEYPECKICDNLQDAVSWIIQDASIS